MIRHPLDALFAPKSLAVFGASERVDSVGAQVLRNLLAAEFPGPIFAINPKHRMVQGQRAYASASELPHAIDLAVIATPAPTVPDLVGQCGEHGIRAAIVLSAGFGEGGRGTELRDTLKREAARHGVRLLGPNCLGLLRPSRGLNATFGHGSARAGSVAMVSQSGALVTAILDWAADTKLGFSLMASLGDALDVGFGEVLDYLALDPETKSIVVYVEGVRDARKFMSGLRVAARLKPVVCVKAGRHAQGERAALSHTGALVGDDDAFDAALRRAGAVRALTIEQLFAAAEILSLHSNLRGNRLVIVTNAGGPAVMAADRAAELGLELPELGTETVARLDQVLPAHWSHANPVDMLGDATAERYRETLKACLDDKAVDGALAMLTPQAMTDPLACAKEVVAVARESKKPVLTCWLGRRQVARARTLFEESGVPTFSSPETSLEGFAFLSRYRESQLLLRQVPPSRSAGGHPDVDGARLIVEGALSQGRRVLTPAESKAVLRAFSIPITASMTAADANAALIAAESIGFPVALKIDSPDITHKSDVGGVRLNVKTARDVRSAFTDLVEAARASRPQARITGVTVEAMHEKRHGRELLAGAVRDPVFGPVIAFGLGGTAVEVLRDRAVALPPLNTFLAADIIKRTAAGRLLGAFRNLPPANLEAVEDVLMRISEAVCELPEIREIEVNPLVADEHGATAVDVRIVVERASASQRRYAHMAIHPYPSHLVSRRQLADGTDVTLRPIRPEDAEIEQTFVRRLSATAKYFRFMSTLTELTQEMLVRFTQIDYDREMAFVAVLESDAGETEIGVARYAVNPDGASSEFALVVTDEWQGKGVGTHLMSALIDTARTRGLTSMNGEVLSDNHPMLELTRSLGFSVEPLPQDPTVRRVSLEL
ncbi:MAG TPA: bifunctional acetate--CoA ligase family protein/GNAT family N-acetyltransferase [Polyangiaceae bacterium]